MHHVILGAGPAGVIAAETLRKAAPADTITLVGGEAEAPYSRMAIPYLIAGNVAESGTHLRHGSDHFKQLRIDQIQAKALRIEPAEQRIGLSSRDVDQPEAGAHAEAAPSEGDASADEHVHADTEPSE